MEAVYLNSFRIALPAASVAKGPALPPPDDKVGAEVQQDVGVGVGRGFGSVRLCSQVGYWSHSNSAWTRRPQATTP